MSWRCKHSLSVSAFRKWNLLTAIRSFFQNDFMVLLILLLCDSPLAATWPSTGLWCTWTPHSPLRLQIDHWNRGTFLVQFLGTASVTSVTAQHPLLSFMLHQYKLEGTWHGDTNACLWRIKDSCVHMTAGLGEDTITVACGSQALKESEVWKNAAELLSEKHVWPAGFHALQTFFYIVHIQFKY